MLRSSTPQSNQIPSYYKSSPISASYGSFVVTSHQYSPYINHSNISPKPITKQISSQNLQYTPLSNNIQNKQHSDKISTQSYLMLGNHTPQQHMNINNIFPQTEQNQSHRHLSSHISSSQAGTQNFDYFLQEKSLYDNITSSRNLLSNKIISRKSGEQQKQTNFSIVSQSSFLESQISENNRSLTPNELINKYISPNSNKSVSNLSGNKTVNSNASNNNNSSNNPNQPGSGSEQEVSFFNREPQNSDLPNKQTTSSVSQENYMSNIAQTNNYESVINQQLNFPNNNQMSSPIPHTSQFQNLQRWDLLQYKDEISGLQAKNSDLVHEQSLLEFDLRRKDELFSNEIHSLRSQLQRLEQQNKQQSKFELRCSDLENQLREMEGREARINYRNREMEIKLDTSGAIFNREFSKLQEENSELKRQLTWREVNEKSLENSLRSLESELLNSRIGQNGEQQTSSDFQKTSSDLGRRDRTEQNKQDVLFNNNASSIENDKTLFHYESAIKPMHLQQIAHLQSLLAQRDREISDFQHLFTQMKTDQNQLLEIKDNELQNLKRQLLSKSVNSSVFTETPEKSIKNHQEIQLKVKDNQIYILKKELAQVQHSLLTISQQSKEMKPLDLEQWTLSVIGSDLCEIQGIGWKIESEVSLDSLKKIDCVVGVQKLSINKRENFSEKLFEIKFSRQFQTQSRSTDTINFGVQKIENGFIAISNSNDFHFKSNLRDESQRDQVQILKTDFLFRVSNVVILTDCHEQEEQLFDQIISTIYGPQLVIALYHSHNHETPRVTSSFARNIQFVYIQSSMFLETVMNIVLEEINLFIVESSRETGIVEDFEAFIGQRVQQTFQQEPLLPVESISDKSYSIQYSQINQLQE